MAEDWATADKRRMLHVVYRVGDLPGTVKFYKEQFGMQVRWLRVYTCGLYTVHVQVSICGQFDLNCCACLPENIYVYRCNCMQPSDCSLKLFSKRT